MSSWAALKMIVSFAVAQPGFESPDERWDEPAPKRSGGCISAPGFGGGGGGGYPALLAVLGLISSTTLTCVTIEAARRDEDVVDEKRQALERYVRSVRSELRREAAVGAGEYLHSFAALLGCPQRARARLFALLRQRHAYVFEVDLQVAAIVERALVLVSEDGPLAQTCVEEL